jgi:hypothetical protein
MFVVAFISAEFERRARMVLSSPMLKLMRDAAHRTGDERERRSFDARRRLSFSTTLETSQSFLSPQPEPEAASSLG